MSCEMILLQFDFLQDACKNNTFVNTKIIPGLSFEFTGVLTGIKIPVYMYKMKKTKNGIGRRVQKDVPNGVQACAYMNTFGWGKHRAIKVLHTNMSSSCFNLPPKSEIKPQPL